jgi:peptidoglycan-associated lipoprotein
MMLMKSWLSAVGVSIFLSGCGSTVKLDEVPVEDRSGSTVNPGSVAVGSRASDSPGVARTAVAPVDLNASQQNAMSSLSRLVYFDYDSFVIKPEFQAVIEAQARFIKADKTRKVAIEGHTDERGGREYNLALGQKRAEAVRRALILLGVADAQMEAVSFGKEKLAATGSDEASMAKNRRAEISYR